MPGARALDPSRVGLLGRDDESAVLDSLMAAARARASGALVLRGEPGVGKSALLDHMTDRAGEMAVLSAYGVESESELPFSGLESLLRPVLGLIGTLSAPQAAALEGALALGPPTPSERFTAYAATLSLLAGAAEEQPVLVLVDDAHWLDSSSMEALVFTARRLGSEGIAMIFAVRTGERTALDGARLPELSLIGLDPRAARTLVRRASGSTVSDAVAAHLHVNTAGNPLALVALAGSLSPDQLAGRRPLEDPLPAADAIQRRFLGESARFSPATRAALLVCAASDLGDVVEIDAALGSMDIDPAALEAAETAGLIAAREGRWEFSHPLFRSAVYQGAAGVERRAAHAALAKALAPDRYPDRHAWHLAGSALGADEATATVLAATAARARERGGYGAAAVAFERAARLTPDPERRAARLLAAALALEFGGRPSITRPLLDDALAATGDRRLRAEIQYARGRMLVFGGDTAAAQRLLVHEARAIQDQNPALATLMLCSAGLSCFMSGDIELALEISGEAMVLGAHAGGPPEMMAKVLRAEASLLSGERGKAEELIELASPILELPQLDPLHLAGMMVAAQSWTWLEKYDRARALLDGMIGLARAQSAAAALPFSLSVLSELDFRTGRWAAASAGATEAIEFGEQTGQENILGYSLVCVARVEAAQGHEEECRAHLRRALKLVKRFNTTSLRVYEGSVTGLLELGLGQPQAAVAALETARAVAKTHSLGEPAAVQWCPDLIEAYIHTRQTDEAHALLGEFEHQASRTQGNWAVATSHRCRGMLADDDHFEREFQRALELHRRLPTPFELARTQLCLGERRRRAGRRTDARAALQAAADTFDALNAEPWTQRARQERDATGAAPRRRKKPPADRLTAQELRVALAVANGATTREAAAQLFLSPKTIEYHLGNIYRKLGVRSRTELARHPTLAES